MYDQDLSMNLSQHLFDIQCSKRCWLAYSGTICNSFGGAAQYIQKVTQAHTPPSNTLATQGFNNCGIPPSQAVSEAADLTLPSPGVKPNHPGGDIGMGNAAAIDLNQVPAHPVETLNHGIQIFAAQELKVEQEKTNRSLLDIKTVLENMNQVLVGTQNSMAKVNWSSVCWLWRASLIRMLIASKGT
jgi:hypothetical protein